MSEYMDLRNLTKSAKDYAKYYEVNDKDVAMNAFFAGSWYMEKWIPIDENTPKDKPLLLWNGKAKCLAYWYETGWYIVAWFSSSGHSPIFTSYKLLPEDPKE